MNEDAELLRRFAEEKAEEAFAELVRNKVDLFYAAALRQTGGDAHLAQDVTQGVFVALAQRAGALKGHAVLTGWLYTTTRFLATKAVRTQARWQRREQKANLMTTQSREPEPAWEELRPVIDETMHELAEQDRTVLLLRFFEGRSLAEVGVALGLAENSARMRVERALEKLHVRLARRGVTSTAAALGVALANQPAVSTPAVLAGVMAGLSPLPAFVRTEALNIMNTLKMMTGLAAAAAAGAGGTYWLAHNQQQARVVAAEARANSAAASLQAETTRLKDEVTRLQQIVAAAESGTPLTELRTLVKAQQQKLIQPLTTLLRTDKGQLQPNVAALFGLTPTEKTALENELDALSRQLDALAAENVARVERPSADSVVVQFNTYPEAGGKTHDHFLTVLRETLGPERESALVTLMGDKFDLAVGNGFGAVERTLTFQRRTAGPENRGAVLYLIIDTTKSVDRQPAAQNSGVLQASRALIDQKYPRVAKLLPPDF